jgi:hypothetical protein
MKNRLIPLGRRHSESDWRGLAANQHQQCLGSILQQRKDFCNRAPSVLVASEPPEIGAGATPIVKRLDIEE